MKFNTCLLNMYRNGRDSVAWHSDNEKVYGPTPTIASISLGEPRDFILRSSWDQNDVRTFALGPGDVLVMEGTNSNLFWILLSVVRSSCAPSGWAFITFWFCFLHACHL